MKVTIGIIVVFSLFSKTLSFQTGFSQAHRLTRIVGGDKSSPSMTFATSNVVQEKETTEWTKKRLHNTPLFRSAALLTAMVAAGVSTQSILSTKALAILHVMSFGTWFGTVVYTTFIAGITMFKNLPRQTFGRLQAKLFPKYFALSSAAIVLQLASLTGLSKVSTASSKRALGLALAMTLINQFILEPKSTNNMMERYRLEELPGGADSQDYAKLKANFGKFHGMSSLANLIALCGGVAHAVYLATALVV